MRGRKRRPRRQSPRSKQEEESSAAGGRVASKQAASKQRPGGPRGLMAAGPVFGLGGGTVQAKLTVNQPGDRSEQEADAVAEQVTTGAAAPAISALPTGGLGGAQRQEGEEPTPEEEMPDEETPAQTAVQRQATEEEITESEETVAASEESVEEEETQTAQAKAQPGSAGSATIASSLTGFEGGGRPLSSASRSYFEPRFGRDFSQVRVHTGSQAARSTQALNARAYTSGSNIAFGAGEYAPEAPSGKKLLAHELTHVVQQQGRDNTIRRKLKIGSEFYDPTKKNALTSATDVLRKKFGTFSREFIDRMHKSADTFSFNPPSELEKELILRHEAVKGMEQANVTGANECCSYPSSSKGFNLNPTYWVKTGNPLFVLKPGQKPSEAVEAIFKPKAGTVLECNSMMVASQYRAMLQTLGADAFDKKFAGGNGLIIGPHHHKFSELVLRPEGFSVVTKRHPIWEENLYTRIGITSAADLLPGDWVYFKNIPDYITKNPGGLWTGEHALYLGDGKFSGFGVKPRNEGDMEKELLNAYNSGITDPAKQVKSVAEAKKQSTAAGKKFGLQNYARRPQTQNIK